MRRIPASARAAALVAVIVAAFVAGRATRAPALRVRVDQFAACDGVRDARAGTQRALEAAVGRTLVVPAGCRLMVGRPVTGSTVLVVPSGTRVHCAGRDAGFVLARRTCARGRYPGAACASDADCLGGGTCGGAPFATTDDGTGPSTLLAAAADGRDVRIDGCTVWVAQRDPYRRCVGGTNDGRPCFQRCDANPAYACDRDADCVAQHAGTSCLGVADCGGVAPVPGTCSGEPGAPAGTGTVNVIDLSNARDAVIRDVVVYDHLEGGVTFAVGTGGRAEIARSDNTGSEFGVLPLSTLTTGGLVLPGLRVETGARILGGGRVTGNTLRARTYGVMSTGGQGRIDGNHVQAEGSPGYGIWTAGGAARISENIVRAPTEVVHSDGFANVVIANELTGNARDAGSIGIWIDKHQQRIVANEISAYTCIAGNPLGGGNVTVSANRCLGGAGPKLVVQGPGWSVSGNYLAWGSGAADAVIQMGGSEAVAGAAGHAVITGNVIHASEPVSLLRFSDVGRRCSGGTRNGRRCSTDDAHSETGCPGAIACPGCCRTTSFDDVSVTDNVFIGGRIGVDASGLVSGGTRLVGALFAANTFGSTVKTGFRLPADASLVSALQLAGNHYASNTTPLAGWRWTMGSLADESSRSPDDDAVQVIRLRNGGGSQASPGDTVEIDPATDGAFRPASLGSGDPIGVVLDAPESGAPGQVAIRGTTTCNTEDATIGRGDRLVPGATAGKLAVAAGSASAFAVALAARSAGVGPASIRCLIGATPGTRPAPPRRAPR